MTAPLRQAKALLTDGGYTCVVCKDDRIHTSTRRGVQPLMMLLEKGTDVGGFYAADKVVGKATAFLYVRLGVAAVYAAVISEAAVAVLQEHGVAVESDRVVPFIINRRGDGMCPFEAAVTEVTDPAKAYAVIRRKMEEMHIPVTE